MPTDSGHLALLRLPRQFLALMALAFLPAGLFLLYSPGLLLNAAGIAANSPSGEIEFRVMYGGLQTAIGALSLWGAIKETQTRAVLVTLFFLFLGVALPRVALGLLYRDFSAYTITAMCLESTALLSIIFLLKRSQSRSPTK